MGKSGHKTAQYSRHWIKLIINSVDSNDPFQLILCARLDKPYSKLGHLLRAYEEKGAYEGCRWSQSEEKGHTKHEIMGIKP